MRDLASGSTFVTVGVGDPEDGGQKRVVIVLEDDAGSVSISDSMAADTARRLGVKLIEMAAAVEKPDPPEWP